MSKREMVDRMAFLRGCFAALHYLQVQQALELISSNFSRIDPVRALKLLPDDASVEIVSEWLVCPRSVHGRMYMEW